MRLKKSRNILPFPCITNENYSQSQSFQQPLLRTWANNETEENCNEEPMRITQGNGTESDDDENISSNAQLLNLLTIGNIYHNFNGNENQSTSKLETQNSDSKDFICNQQYRHFVQKQHNEHYEKHSTVEKTNINASICDEGHFEVQTKNTAIAKKRSDFSDTAAEPDNRQMPRGIVNPNYPGFQHLAHTLKDYSSNIENFYPSDNDMTDDDDEETELSYDTISSQDNLNLKPIESISHSSNNIESQPIVSMKDIVPDLIQSVGLDIEVKKDSGNIFTNLVPDFENNFSENIIGNFNKEVEFEINNLLNYNISIPDDIDELKRDIKDTISKPIEDTINNISEVVNGVIIKLINFDEMQLENATSNKNKLTLINKSEIYNSSYNMNNPPEKNIRISRPSFLLIEKSTDEILQDAFLSDGRDEIYLDELSRLSDDATFLKLGLENESVLRKRNIISEIQNISCKKAYNGNFDEDRDSCYHINHTTEHNTLAEKNETRFKKNPNTKISKSLRKERATMRESRKYSDSHAMSVEELRGSETRSSKSFEVASNDKNLENKRSDFEGRRDQVCDCYDVYTIETALPTLDLDAIESHLRAAKEAERRKQNDREEIRRQLAMGITNEEFMSLGHTERPCRKPSLQSRLQSGKNLQICFMNEHASDNEFHWDLEKVSSETSYTETSTSPQNNTSQAMKFEKATVPPTVAKLRPPSMLMKPSKSRSTYSLSHIEFRESDFHVLQATLQTEARIALAQAKEIAHVQMEMERKGRAVSPVRAMVRRSMEKASAPLAPDRRRLSRLLLTDMNIAQLQVIVNELHGQIETLNEALVRLLMARDELHMRQDSMLVDIEDLTRYLGVKEQSKKTKGSRLPSKRLASLSKK